MTLSLTGRFTANKTTDGDYDTQRFDGSIGLVKNVSNVFGLPDDKAILSVKLTYSRFIDLVHQGADLKNTPYFSCVRLAPNLIALTFFFGQSGSGETIPGTIVRGAQHSLDAPQRFNRIGLRGGEIRCYSNDPRCGTLIWSASAQAKRFHERRRSRWGFPPRASKP